VPAALGLFSDFVRFWNSSDMCPSRTSCVNSRRLACFFFTTVFFASRAYSESADHVHYPEQNTDLWNRKQNANHT
jgi:hypothetical protein